MYQLKRRTQETLLIIFTIAKSHLSHPPLYDSCCSIKAAGRRQSTKHLFAICFRTRVQVSLLLSLLHPASMRPSDRTNCVGPQLDAFILKQFDFAEEGETGKSFIVYGRRQVDCPKGARPEGIHRLPLAVRFLSQTAPRLLSHLTLSGKQVPLLSHPRKLCLTEKTDSPSLIIIRTLRFSGAPPKPTKAFRELDRSNVYWNS